MGFPPAEVAAGVEAVLAANGYPSRSELDGERRLYRAAAVRVTVEPLPPGRTGIALFQPRTLLVVDGDDPLAETLKAAIRLKFLRVTG